MVVAVPFSDPPSYCRAIEAGFLELFAHGFCGLCGWVLWANGWSCRKFQSTKTRRARCSNPRCRTSFTFLPMFLAPAKWHAYPAIQQVTDFLSKFQTVSAGITAWDLERCVDRDNHLEPRPSASTAYRWWASLWRAAESAWLALAVSQIFQRAPDHPLPFQEGSLTTPHRRAKAMVQTLMVLGGLIKYGVDDLKSACALALALWCVEPIRRRRVLEPPSCVGRVAPGPSPSLEFREGGPKPYPPGPSPPDSGDTEARQCHFTTIDERSGRSSGSR